MISHAICRQNRSFGRKGFGSKPTLPRILFALACTLRRLGISASQIECCAFWQMIFSRSLLFVVICVTLACSHSRIPARCVVLFYLLF